MGNFREGMRRAVAQMADPDLIERRLALTVDRWRATNSPTKKARYWVEIEALIERLEEVIEK